MSEAVLVRARELDVSTLAVIATDANGSVIYWSSGATRLYGWSSSEAIGRDVLELTPSEDSKERAAEIMRQLRNGQSWNGELRLRDRSGNSFACSVTDVPVRGADGALLGIIGLSQRSSTSSSPGLLRADAIRKPGRVHSGSVDALHMQQSKHP